jgi:hypothetical protein
LPTPHFDDVSWLDIGPRDRLESFEFGSDHQKFEHLVIDLIGDLPLTQLKCDVPDRHQGDVHRESHDWE